MQRRGTEPAGWEGRAGGSSPLADGPATMRRGAVLVRMRPVAAAPASGMRAPQGHSLDADRPRYDACVWPDPSSRGSLDVPGCAWTRCNAASDPRATSCRTVWKRRLPSCGLCGGREEVAGRLLPDATDRGIGSGAASGRMRSPSSADCGPWARAASAGEHDDRPLPGKNGRAALRHAWEGRVGTVARIARRTAPRRGFLPLWPHGSGLPIPRPRTSAESRAPETVRRVSGAGSRSCRPLPDREASPCAPGIAARGPFTEQYRVQDAGWA
ncbi:hypothetical protein FHS88_003845 [Roseomonas alkaliterrae]|uniref:Uncharacterized protein n=1 Tax=Neoroseomonas alkaliterrae TaxID=1452450 RepID=A0A840YCQ9_9PROT|nr:hypothetical protein [Neoroseomonas alkaliterrae]